ncbi:MAG: GspH/FimT family pseudopilin [Methylophilaceae bacterium]
MLIQQASCPYPTKGFTLVELMITVALLGIITIIAIPSYTVWIQNQQIRAGAESIQNGLQKARTEAVKRNALVRFVLGASSAWRLECVTVVGDLDGDGQADCPALIEQRAASEGSSSQISTVATPAAADTIVFTSLGLVQASPPSPTAPFTSLRIQHTNMTKTRQLQINIGAGGNIRMCDPDTNLPTSDVRRC